MRPRHTTPTTPSLSLSLLDNHSISFWFSLVRPPTATTLVLLDSFRRAGPTPPNFPASGDVSHWLKPLQKSARITASFQHDSGIQGIKPYPPIVGELALAVEEKNTQWCGY